MANLFAKRGMRWFLWILLVIILILLYRYFFYYFRYTRDAFVYANHVNVSSLVSGHIEKIYIRNNQHVKKSQLLITIDPRPFQYAYHQAEAELKNAKVAYQNAMRAVQVAQQNLNEKKSALALSQDHLTRYQKLVKEGAISEIIQINYQSQVRTNQAAVHLAEQQLVMANENVNYNEIRKAEAKLQTASFNLNHCRVRAPFSGYVTNFYLTKGTFMRRGTFMFALVDNSHWWVIARFRETVLRKIHPGDKAWLYIDMYPYRIFHGTVASIGWGINRFQDSKTVIPSGLIYMKPTEDWVRIAQRFPVMIRVSDVNAKYPFRVGANARAYVK